MPRTPFIERPGLNHFLLGVPVGERYAAGQLLAQCPRVRIRARSAVVAADLPASRFVLVEDGVVLLAVLRPRWSRPIVLTLAAGGSVLGAPADDERLCGLTDARLLLVPRPQYEALLRLPRVSLALADALLDAMREREESLAAVTGGQHAERLREKLCQLAARHGRVSPDGVEVDLPLTHELLAQLVGSARETVTTALAALRREGFLVRDRGSYRLKVSPQALENGSRLAAPVEGRRGG